MRNTGYACATGVGEFTMGKNLVGDLDEVRVWNYARTATETLDQMDAFLMFDPPGGTAALTGEMVQIADTASTFEQVTTWTTEAWIRLPPTQGAAILVAREADGPQGTYPPFVEGTDPIDLTVPVVPPVAGPFGMLWNHALGVDGAGALVAAYSVSYEHDSDDPFAAGPQFTWNKKYRTVTVKGLTDLRDNQWHHVVSLFDGANLVIYVDGIRQGRELAASPRNSSERNYQVWNAVGQTVVARNLVGLIDEVRIWNAPLSSQAIDLRKGKSLQGTEQGLIDYFNFDFNRMVDPRQVRNYAVVRPVSDDYGQLVGGALDATDNAPVIINAMLGLQDVMVAYFPFDDQGVRAEDFLHRNDISFAGELSGDMAFVNAVDRDTFAWDAPTDPDSDGDGMPDWWETSYGLLPTSVQGDHGAQGDPDSDGLSNLTEYYIDRLPDATYPDGISQPNQYDSDADGISDGDEDADQDGLRNAEEGLLGSWAWTADTDDDSLTDDVELANGTSPVRSLDPLVFRALQLDGAPTTFARVEGDRLLQDFEFAATSTPESAVAFTLEAWVNPADSAGGELIRKVGRFEKRTNYLLGLDNFNHLVLRYEDVSGRSTKVTLATTSLPVHAWSYVAATFAGANTVDTDNDAVNDAEWYGTVTLYVSVPESAGVLTDHTAQAVVTRLPAAGTGDLTFGADFAGRLDEIRLWNLARTAAELQTDANRRVPLLGTEAGLAGYWRFDDSQAVVNGMGAEDFTRALDPEWPTAARLVGACTFVEDTGGIVAGDTDGDGLPDGWELTYFGDLTHDGTEDADADGLTNLTEYLAGTNPQNADTDGDGISDYEEDSDNDGLSNGIEQDLQSDPGDADSDDDGFADLVEVRADLPSVTDIHGVVAGYSGVNDPTSPLVPRSLLLGNRRLRLPYGNRFSFSVPPTTLGGPVVDIQNPLPGETTDLRFVSVVGTVTTTANIVALRLYNNDMLATQLPGDVVFNQVMIIDPGTNHIVVEAEDDAGMYGYGEVTITSTAPYADLRITQTWTPAGDLDTWLLDPTGRHMGWTTGGPTYPLEQMGITGNPGLIPGAFLDVDDIPGTGPENITLEQGYSISGTYQVWMNNFSNDNNPESTVRVLVKQGTANEQYVEFGPESIPSYDLDGDDPAAWWHVTDVDGDTGAMNPAGTPVLAQQQFLVYRPSPRFGWTIEAWLRPGATLQTGTLFEYHNPSGLVAYSVGLRANQPFIRVLVADDAGTTTEHYESLELGPLAPNAWSHIAYQYDQEARELRIVVNGVSVGKAATGVNIRPDGYAFLDTPSDGIGFSDCLLDEFRVWNSARGLHLIEYYRYRHVRRDAATLLAYYRFDDGGLSIEDFAFLGDEDYTLKGSGISDAKLDLMPGADGDWLTGDEVAASPTDTWNDTNGDGILDIEDDYGTGVGVTTDGHADLVTALDAAPVHGVRDDDKDGIEDWYEERFFGGLAACDPVADPDRDGLRNLYEFMAATNPLVRDTDGDGIEDLYEDSIDADGFHNLDEQTAGTDPRRADTDDDGLTDAAEHAAGTDPADALSPAVSRSLFVDGSAASYAELPWESERFAQTSFALSAWIYPLATADGVILRRTVGTRADGAAIVNYEVGVRSRLGALVPYVRVSPADGSADVAAPCADGLLTTEGLAIPLNAWTHVAAVLYGRTGDLSLLINGVRVANAILPAAASIPWSNCRIRIFSWNIGELA